MNFKDKMNIEEVRIRKKEREDKYGEEESVFSADVINGAFQKLFKNKDSLENNTNKYLNFISEYTKCVWDEDYIKELRDIVIKRFDKK